MGKGNGVYRCFQSSRFWWLVVQYNPMFFAMWPRNILPRRSCVLFWRGSVLFVLIPSELSITRNSLLGVYVPTGRGAIVAIDMDMEEAF